MTDRTVDLWKLVGTALLGACVTGVAFFLVESTKHTTKDELRSTLMEAKEYAEMAGPYARDKGTIFTRLDSIDMKLTEIKVLIDRLPR